ncbi:hypothetical protein D3C79_881960 [compost metagenome]
MEQQVVVRSSQDVGVFVPTQYGRVGDDEGNQQVQPGPAVFLGAHHQQGAGPGQYGQGHVQHQEQRA